MFGVRVERGAVFHAASKRRRAQFRAAGDSGKCAAIARQIGELGRWTADGLRQGGALDRLRGAEGMGSATSVGVFSLLLKQQREDFGFAGRSRRPPRDRINSLLSFLYALVRHDCIAALTSVGLDPFVGFLHAERPTGQPWCWI
jgi:CRISPR/Cas system-associated endonuclease Cas1